MDRPPPTIGAAGLLDPDVAGRMRVEIDIQRPVVVVIAGDLLPLLPVGGKPDDVALRIVVG